MESMIVGISSALLVAALAAVVHWYFVKALKIKLRDQLQAADDAERNTHLKEMQWLAGRKAAEAAHADALVQVRAMIVEEARKQARVEMELEISARLAEQRSEFALQLHAEREQSAKEAGDRLRADFERDFSIEVSPYTLLVENKGIIKNRHEAQVGYQYHLLIKGVPAFPPHIVVERRETLDQVDQKVKDDLYVIAQTLAKVAAGKIPLFAKFSPRIGVAP